MVGGLRSSTREGKEEEGRGGHSLLVHAATHSWGTLTYTVSLFSFLFLQDSSLLCSPLALSLGQSSLLLRAGVTGMHQHTQLIPDGY